RLVAWADVRMIASRMAEIAKTLRLTEEAHTILEERLLLSRWDERTCWAAIDRFCQDNEQCRSVEEVDLGSAKCLVEAVSRLGRRQGERALGILQAGPRSYSPRAYTWLAMLMTDLVGRQRVRAAIPFLVPILGYDHLLAVWSMRALSRIGTPELVEAL